MKRGKHQGGFAERLPDKAVPEAKQLRKLAGDWLKQRRADAELSQADLAARLGLKYYTFISQVRTGSVVFQLKLWGRGPASWVLNRRRSRGIC
jgi:transcriptional regulator with XRE-family HTH domain